jgi:amino acid adenylation domain-containing protein
VVDGEPVQEIVAERELALPLVDLGSLADSEREAEALRLAREEVRNRFDLARGPLIRARLLRLSGDEHWFVLTMHHIVRDGTSNVILAHELEVLYRAFRAGQPSPLPPLPGQYADYARAQHAWLRGAACKEQLAFWKHALAGLTTLGLPTDRPRPPQPTFRGGRVSFTLGEELVGGLRALAESEETTLFTLLIAALHVLLYRYSGQEDVAIGIPVAGRNRSEFAGTIGYFVNLVVLRGELHGEPPFRQYLTRVRRQTHEAYARQELPFARLVRETAPERDSSRNPLFQVTLVKGTEPRERPDLDGLEVMDLGIRGPDTAKFDLHFSVSEERGRIAGEIEYATDLFDASTVERMAKHWRALLDDIAAHPDRSISALRLIDDASRHRAIVEWNDSRRGYPGDTGVAALFVAQARSTPAAMAIVDGDIELNYAALERRARAVARRLSALGIAPGSRIGVCIERSAHEVVAILGALLAGCVYVPLDPAHPPERLAGLLSAADAAAVVAVRASLRALATAHSAGARAMIVVDDEAPPESDMPDTIVERGGDDLAYIMYTSGSTGEPKGVAVPHRAIVRLVRGTDYVQLGGSDVVGHLSNPAFDASTFEVWGALLNGARLVVIARKDVLSPRDLAGTLDRQQVTTLFLTTALFNQIARDAPHAINGRVVLFGGEGVDPRAVAAALREGNPRRLLHVYGPTETTTFATWHEVRAVDAAAITVPIGRPIANTEVYVLDRHGEPVPPGVPGEIYIGGPGLALGYHGRPDLTAERFVAHPFDPTPGARLFRTGDRARYRDDGAIEFLDRLDRQVKIRGHRIEPGEVEAALVKLPQVAEAVVVVHGEASETKRLVAYVVPTKGAKLAAAEVRRELSRILPGYMLPSAIGILTAFPLTPNGKIDRLALPSPEDLVAGTARWRMPPRDPLEHMLAGIWEGLLGSRKIGIRDNFFDLGGHSLLAAQMMDAVAQQCGATVPLTTLFSEPTIEQLARAIRGQVAPSGTVVAIRESGTGLPFFFLHGDFSGGGFYCHALAREMGSEQPFYAVHPHGLEASEIPDSIEAMAEHLVRDIRRVRPHGPYLMGGHCNGGLVAVEMARQLAAEGEDVPLVVVLDANVPTERTSAAADEQSSSSPGPGPAQGSTTPGSPLDVFYRYRRAVGSYAPARYRGRIAVLRSAETRDKNPDLGWSSIAEQVETFVIPGSHHTSITRHVATTGACIKACLEAAAR